MAEPDSLLSPTPSVPGARSYPGSNPGGTVINNVGRNLDDVHPQLFSTADMIGWIQRRLGGEVWRLEGLEGGAGGVIGDAILEGIARLSARIPRIWFEAIPHGATTYVVKNEAVIGVIRVDFTYPLYTTGSLGSTYEWNSNLTGVGVIPQAGPGLILPSGDLNSFLVFRKTFGRVTSLKPDHFWDSASRTIHIYNPAKHNACALLTVSKTWREITSSTHRLWVRDFALARCREILAEIRSKFDGSIPMPGGGALNLGSAALQDRATKNVEDLMQDLYSMQTRAPILWGD